MKCGPTRKTSDEEEEEEEEKKKEENCGDTHTALKGEELEEGSPARARLGLTRVINYQNTKVCGKHDVC